MKLRIYFCLSLLGLITACTPPADTAKQGVAAPVSDTKSGQSERDEAKLYGAWRIVSLNDSPAKVASEDRVPRINFWPSGYGSNTGCNDFGGQGLLKNGRYFTQIGPMTMAACQDVMAQEDAIVALMRDGPTVTFMPDGKVTLISKDTRIVLAKDAVTTRSMSVLDQPAPTLILAGTAWQISSVDGRWLKPRNQRESRPLIFEAGQWSAKPACASLSGGWQQQGRSLITTSPKTEDGTNCPPEEAVTDATVMNILQANPSFAPGDLAGLGSELLVVGDGHWLTASRNPALEDEAPLLKGNWRVMRIDGVSPIGARAVTLTFGSGRYVGDTGCNSIGGIFLAQNRRLFTLLTPQTEMGCGDLTDQEARINAVLAASPRVAKVQSGGIALIDAKGQLTLQRDVQTANLSEQAPTSALEGVTRRIEVQQIDGEILSKPFRLSFNTGRWATTLGCGMSGGDWLKSDGVYAFATDSGPYPPPSCAPSLQSLKDKLSGVMNGQGRVIFGPNGEFLLATRDDWIVGQSELQ